jgi:cell division protease FtsH
MAAGASGAELANIVNEAALRAVRDGPQAATQADLEESVEVVIAGYQKKNAILSDRRSARSPITRSATRSSRRCSPALRARAEDHDHSAHLRRARLHDAGGGSGQDYLLTKEELENKIATLTAGRAAEEVAFGRVTTGASNDIEQATKLARAMITRYGMSDEFDMVAMETVTNQYLGGDTSLACSADTQNEIDRRVVEVIKREHKRAKDILTENRAKLDELANYLYEKETITGEEFMKILSGSAAPLPAAE